MTRSILFAIAIAFSGSVSADDLPEQSVLDALEHAEGGNPVAAQRILSNLLWRQPNFELAAALLADLERGGDGSLASYAPDVTRDRLSELQDEMLRRHEAVIFDPGRRVPSVLIQISAIEQTALVMDASRSRLYLFAIGQSGSPELIDQFYASVGSEGLGKQLRGDLRTPTGVFRITHRIDGDELPDLYGAGALPLDYPNAWDRARERTGDGIWLHGVPSSSYSRAPLATRGCLAVSDAMFDAILPAVVLGRTPVIIADSLDWVDAELVREEAMFFERAVDAWLATSVTSMQRDMEVKTDLHERITDLSVQRVPGEEDLVVTTFALRRGDEREASLEIKQLYWQRDQGGEWRVVLEAAL